MTKSATARLRDDLRVLPTQSGRVVLIVDDIAGRFSRVSRSVWTRLCSGTEVDPGIWNQAVAAGWTRQRFSPSQSTRWSPLSIRVPLFSIDSIAQKLLPWSGGCFAPLAIAFWLTAAMIALILVMLRWDHWAGSAPSLANHLRSLSPITIVVIFVATKTIHELGHAVACRRMGSRCGVIGVWFLLLFPCPYVDVTEVWRHSSSVRRAAVMAAGMWVELIVATLAAWVWNLSDDPPTRLMAMNVVLVCGVSTLVFNANPLMRYDGYFIISDLLQSANLRFEAGNAMHRILVAPVRRWVRLGTRTWALSTYHLASLGYRVVIALAIAGLVMAWWQSIGGWRLGALTLLIATAMAIVRLLRKGLSIVRGDAMWSKVSPLRRYGLVGGLVLFGLALAVVPTPRVRHLDGNLRAASAIPVYLPPQGVLRKVTVGVGDGVEENMILAEVMDPELELRIQSGLGQLAVLHQRSRAARLASLSTKNVSDDRNPRRSSSQWEVLETAERSTLKQNELLASRQRELTVRSPAPGMVLSVLNLTETHQPVDGFRLSPQVGESTNDRTPWCRIATDTALEAEFSINAEDRERIGMGTRVSIVPKLQSSAVWSAHVVSVSPLEPESMPASHSGSKPSEADVKLYRVICRMELPDGESSIPPERLPQWDGSQCHAVVPLPPRTVTADVVAILRRAVGF